MLLNNTVEGCDWRCRDLLEEILGSLDRMKGDLVSLVARGGNKAANNLAVNAARKMHQHDWLILPTSSLSNILDANIELIRDPYSIPVADSDKEGIG